MRYSVSQQRRSPRRCSWSPGNPCDFGAVTPLRRDHLQQVKIWPTDEALTLLLGHCQLTGHGAPFSCLARLERGSTMDEQKGPSDLSRRTTETTSTPLASKLTMPVRKILAFAMRNDGGLQ